MALNDAGISGEDLHVVTCGCSACMGADASTGTFLDAGGAGPENFATATGNSVGLTGNIFADGLIHGARWDTAGSGGTISYGLYDSNYGSWNGARSTAIDAVFDAYEAVIDVDFVDNGTTGTDWYYSDGLSARYFNNSTDVSIVLYDAYAAFGYGVAGVGFFPDPAFATSGWSTRPGDMILDYRFMNANDVQQGGFGFKLMLHEVGHALGLKHPHDNGGTGRPTFPQLGLSGYDNDHHTVMSYNEVGNSRYYGNNATLMPLDILAIQSIYGANMSTNAGDTTYSFAENGMLQTIWDGGGNDTFDFSGKAQSVTIDLAAVSGQMVYRAGYTGWALAYNVDIENVTGGSYNDTIKGSALSNRLSGNNGSDWIEGRAGNDTLLGGGSSDVLLGGAGADTLYGGDAGDTLKGESGADTIWGESGSDWIEGGDGADTVRGGFGEDVVFGGADGDNLYGDDGNDTLYGEAGNDSIDGGSGQDHVAGGAGLDTLHGGADRDVVLGEGGDDRLYGGTGNDVVKGGDGDDVVEAGDGPDYVEGNAGADEIHGDPGNDVVWGDDPGGPAATDRLYGGAGNDYLYGFGGQDYLYGEADEDWLQGGDGVDRLEGGTGNDVLIGEGDGDTLYGGDGNDVLKGEAGNDWLYGEAGPDYFEGGEGNDLLYGAGGNDVLMGGNGDDLLQGDGGNDVLYGGAGNDHFHFEGAVATDALYDFEAGAGVGDLIHLAGFSGFASFADVQGAMSVYGAFTRIQLSASDNILIHNVAQGSFHSDDFMFT